ncbi:MAG: hypothetical protein R3A49_01835 [Acidimicrobiia bacterium]
MHRRRSLLWTIPLSLLLFLAACDEEPSADDREEYVDAVRAETGVDEATIDDETMLSIGEVTCDNLEDYMNDFGSTRSEAELEVLDTAEITAEQGNADEEDLEVVRSMTTNSLDYLCPA